MNVKSLLDLYQHMEWADATVWTAIFDAENSKSDEKTQALLHHIHGGHHAFLHMWKNKPGELSVPELNEAPSLMRWGQDYYRSLYEYINSLDDGKVGAEFIFPASWVDMVEQHLEQKPEKATLGEAMVYISLHTMHHRGQICTRLRELGSTPPTIDYITWVWLGRPAARWPGDIS
jgi:uncharacterized damage-inducible protein DinB